MTGGRSSWENREETIAIISRTLASRPAIAIRTGLRKFAERYEENDAE